MKCSTAELVEKLSEAARQLVSPDEADYFAQESVEAHLRKAPRSNPIKSSVGDIKACLNNKDKGLVYRVDLPSFISIDFQSHGPLVYLKRIHDELERRSSENGLAMAAFTNSRSMHELHTWVQGLAKRGLVAIAVCNGGPEAVVPFNGTKGIFGTNPIAYGIPGDNSKIHCVDMATSEIPYFEIMNAYKNKEPLQERVALDQDGNFTTDAGKALDFSESENSPISNIAPLGGGYKGYYLIYLLELLTSGLIGMPSSPEMTTDFVPEEHGAILIVFNPKVMGTENALTNSLNSIHAALKIQKPKEGESIRIPGDENNKKFNELKDKEIEIAEAIWNELDTFVGN